MQRVCYPIIAVIAFLVLPATAFAAPPGPMDFMKAQMESVFEILDREVEPGSEEAAKRVTDLRAIIDNLIDYEDLARRSLGEHWEPRTEEERAAYVERFQKLIHLSYVDRIDDGGKRRRDDYTLEWEEETVGEKRSSVLVFLLYEDTETELNWTLVPVEDSYRLFDLAIDGASIEGTYRKNYGEIIEKEGFDQLIIKMDERIEKLSK